MAKKKDPAADAALDDCCASLEAALATLTAPPVGAEGDATQPKAIDPATWVLLFTAVIELIKRLRDRK